MIRYMMRQTSVWQSASQKASSMVLDMSSENSPMIHFITKQFSSKPHCSRCWWTCGKDRRNSWSSQSRQAWQKSTSIWMQRLLCSKQRSSQQVVFQLKHCRRLAQMGMMPWKYLTLKERVVMMRSSLNWCTVTSSLFWFQKQPLVRSRSSLCSQSSLMPDYLRVVSRWMQGVSRFRVRFQLLSLKRIWTVIWRRMDLEQCFRLINQSQFRNQAILDTRECWLRKFCHVLSLSQYLGGILRVKGEGWWLKRGSCLCLRVERVATMSMSC